MVALCSCDFVGDEYGRMVEVEVEVEAADKEGVLQEAVFGVLAQK
jgi:hypothetical protein